MKKRVLLVVFLFFVVSVSAESIEYNYGDKVLLKGSYFFDTPGREEVSLVLNCNGNEIGVGLLMLNSIYSGEVPVEKEVIIPNKMEGDCQFILKGKKEVVLENVRINGELVGEVNINDNSFQLGENLILNGQITKKNSENVNGVASFYFVRNGEVVFTDFGDVVDGSLIYDNVLKGIASGEYILDVEVKDAYGNNLFLDDVLKFIVIDTVNLNVNLDKNEYFPGELIVVRGSVVGNAGDLVANQKVTLKFSDENVYENEVDGGSFEFNYKLINGIKSGAHQFLVVVNDENGNYAEKSLMLSVIGVPTDLSLVLNSDSVVAGSPLNYRIDLFDQAKDLLNKDVMFKIDCDDFQKEMLVDSNKENILDIPYFVKPGLCKLSVSDDILLSEGEVNILEKKEVDIHVDGEYLVLTNIGNVKYKDSLNLVSNNSEENIRINIGVNESKRMPLNSYLNVGKHDIKVNDLPFSVQVTTKRGFFSSITGNVIGSDDSSSTGFLFGFIVVLVLLVYIFKPKPRKVIEENHEYLHVEKAEALKDFNDKAYKKADLNKPTVKKKQKFGVATEEDRKDFKERMIKQVRDQEMKNKRYTSNSKEPPTGMFNMFG